MDTVQVSAFRWVPPFAQGYVRDLRVRWALEEAGRPYAQRLIGFDDQNSAAYRAVQPFGQVPAFEEDGLALFESGAIVLHIAERSEALMPADAADRARVQTWLFAALNTVEPPVLMRNFMDMQPGGVQDGQQSLRERVLHHIDLRLGALADALGAQPYLVAGRFTAADLLMATVLRELDAPDSLTTRPALDDYQARCLDRPAFKKALADQLAAFAQHAPPAAG